MQRFSAFDVDELKLVYRILHKNLLSHMELMDADFVDVLQTWLQYRAGEDGVDVSDHAQWDAWLKGAVPSPPANPSGGTVIPLTIGQDSDDT